jgi:hypothetical protein
MSQLPVNKAFRLYCTGDATITDVVTDVDRTAARTSLQTLIGSRVYAGFAPQTHDPAKGAFLNFRKVRAESETNMLGNAGLRHTTFEVTGECMSPEDRETLSETLFTALHGYYGTITYDGETVTVQMCSCESEGEDYDLVSEGGDDYIYGFTQTYEIAHAA